MTGGNLEIAYVFIQTIAMVIAIVLGALMIHKAIHRWKQYRQHKVMRHLEPYFYYLKSHLKGDDPLPLPPEAIRGIRRKVMQLKLAEWVDGLEEQQRDKLNAFCEQLGIVDWNLARLQSRIGKRRVEAAYYLGLLKVHRAVPYLMKELKRQKFESPLFIIARSISRCARHEQDIEEMVQYVLKQRKPAHRLVADIIEEADTDTTRMLERWLHHASPDIVKIALLCLEGKPADHLLPTLTELLRSGEPEIRLFTAKLLLATAAHLPDSMLYHLMKHSDWEIRAEAARMAHEWHHPLRIDWLREGLKDVSWEVRQSCATSLAAIGDSGMTVLREVATASNSDLIDAELARDMIQTELSKDWLLQDRKENIAQ